jgi:hypothetical protein
MSNPLESFEIIEENNQDEQYSDEPSIKGYSQDYSETESETAERERDTKLDIALETLYHHGKVGYYLIMNHPTPCYSYSDDEFIYILDKFGFEMRTTDRKIRWPNNVIVSCSWSEKKEGYSFMDVMWDILMKNPYKEEENV